MTDSPPLDPTRPSLPLARHTDQVSREREQGCHLYHLPSLRSGTIKIHSQVRSSKRTTQRPLPSPLSCSSPTSRVPHTRTLSPLNGISSRCNRDHPVSFDLMVIVLNVTSPLSLSPKHTSPLLSQRWSLTLVVPHCTLAVVTLDPSRLPIQEVTTLQPR